MCTDTPYDTVRKKCRLQGGENQAVKSSTFKKKQEQKQKKTHDVRSDSRCEHGASENVLEARGDGW
jgi:hypothetical protein